ncbi:MAG: intradiol ring-cleavage dioxygenase [Chloroflexia bacterium]
MNAEIEHDDDRPIGRLLTRREVIALLAGAGTMLLVGCDTAGQATGTPTQPMPGSASPTEAAQPTAGSSSPTGAPAQPTPGSESPTTAPTQTAAGTSLPTSGSAQAAATVGTDTLPSCVVRPAETEGPYFVDEKINRSDIRSDPSDGSVKQGAPLRLTFRVSQVGANACTPLVGSQVDVWHCDALGVYSDSQDPGFNTVGKKFLRGYQLTDGKGTAAFTTIYPGWYQGRAVHIHFKIRTNPGSASGHEFTSQLYFDDTLTDKVQAQPPYAAKGQRAMRNNADGIYQSGGDQLLLQVTGDGQGGYAATFDVGLQIG